jgi:SH3-like domain-containing protein
MEWMQYLPSPFQSLLPSVLIFRTRIPKILKGALIMTKKKQREGEVGASKSSLKEGIKATTTTNEEIVAIIEYNYLNRELTDDDKETIRINRGFVNSEKKLIITPWAENPELKMNQKQADSLEVVEILKRMSLNETGYLARVKYI